MTVEQEPWGQVGASNANLYTITNHAVVSVQLTGFGAAVVQMNMPCHKGEIADGVLGYATLQDYVDAQTLLRIHQALRAPSVVDQVQRCQSKCSQHLNF